MTPLLSEADLEALRDLASAALEALPGDLRAENAEYFPGTNRVRYELVTASNGMPVAKIPTDDTSDGAKVMAAFYAALSPALVSRLLSHIDALSQQPGEVDVERWQSMDTAPKDGRVILVQCERGVVAASWMLELEKRPPDFLARQAPGYVYVPEVLRPGGWRECSDVDGLGWCWRIDDPCVTPTAWKPRAALAALREK